MPFRKDDPEEILQFDAAMVAIRAGKDAETLAKLGQLAYELTHYTSGMMEQHGIALAPAVPEEQEGSSNTVKRTKMLFSKDDPEEILQFDAAMVAIRAGKDAETLAKLRQFADELTRYTSGMMEQNGIALAPAVPEQEKDVKPEACVVKKEESDENIVKEEEVVSQPQLPSSAPINADEVGSTDAASGAGRKRQAKDEEHSGYPHQKKEAQQDLKTSPDLKASPSDSDGDAGQRKRKRNDLSPNNGELEEAKEEASSTGNDSDGTSVEDVSDKMAADKEATRKARAQDDVISIQDSSDENESLFDSENDEIESVEDDEDEIIDSEEDESEDDDDSEYEDDTESDVETKRKAGKKKPVLPSIHVKMNPKDVPSAPGCDEARLREESAESYSLMDAEPSFLPTKSKDEVVKERVIKLLNTGFHQGSNEHEARAAMKLAQKLMQRHNLSQVLLMKERDIADKKGTEPESLKGGMAKVSILNAKSQKASPFYHWIRLLAHAVSDNFRVDFFYVHSGGECSATFYGIYINVQLAAYAFKVATERVSVMMQEYSKSVKLRSTYARGIARGLVQEVEEVQKREEEKRKAKLEKARLSVRNGEAYEESDDDSDEEEDDDDSQEGAGFTFAESATSPAAASNESAEASTFASPTTTTDSNAPTAMPKDAPLDDKESASQRLERLEKREEATLALVDHHEQVAKDFLKERNIKLRSARKMTSVDTKSKAYEDGLRDSSQLDINQRAIRNGVKKEKTAA